jgi:hypothetical protein
MTETRDPDVGWSMFLVGAVMMAVGLLGADTTGDTDWAAVSIGLGGAFLTAAGLHVASRRRGTRGPSRTAH